MGRLIDKHGAVAVVFTSLCCNITGCFILSFSHTLWHFLAAAVVNAVGGGRMSAGFPDTEHEKLLPSGGVGQPVARITSVWI
jgi:MFS family permease